MKTVQLIISLIICCSGFSQPINDACENAIRICPGETYTGSTIGATQQASDYNVCYTSENSIWYVFTTNSVGGGVTVDFTNLVFNTDPSYGQNLQALFFKTSGGCGVTPYTPMSDCGDDITDFSINEIVVLAPNTDYYIQISGSKDGTINPSECTFDIEISGTGVEVSDPTATISMSTLTLCQGVNQPVDITALDCEEEVNYEWLYNGASIANGSTNNFSTESLTESGTLQLLLTCGANCPKTDNSNIIDLTIIPVSAEAGPDAFIEEGEQANLLGSGVGDPIWSPASSLSSPYSTTTVASPTNTTTYFLSMENIGCFATDSVTVYVGDVITIFSAFSPNGDNINDKWHILNSEKFPNMEVNIYNRFGQLVFSAVNYSQENQWWDGTFKGKDLPVSTYYYVIRLNDEDNTEYKGDVNILR